MDSNALQGRTVLVVGEYRQTVTVVRSLARAGMRVTFASPDPVTPGPVRISLACDGEVRHETSPGIDAPDKGWSHILAPPCTPAAVLVEDLARERWRAVRIDYSK